MKLRHELSGLVTKGAVFLREKHAAADFAHGESLVIYKRGVRKSWLPIDRVEVIGLIGKSRNLWEQFSNFRILKRQTT